MDKTIFCRNTLRQVRYGKNKDGEKLPQINLALIFGEESGLPFYYRKVAGNIPDVKTALTSTINVFDILKYSTVVVTKAAVETIEEVYA